jgi:hypothetical protein
MTRHEEISALQERIARTETQCDAWRASGVQEKYLEAYSMVEALELQLDRVRESGRTRGAARKAGSSVPARQARSDGAT